MIAMRLRVAVSMAVACGCSALALQRAPDGVPPAQSGPPPAAGGVAATKGLEPRVVRIGAVTGQLDVQSPESFRPFTDYLSARIPGVRFEMAPLASIEELLRAVERRQVDFAFCTPAAFVELDVRVNARPIATVTQTLGDGRVYPWLAGAVFVRSSREDIRGLESVRGKRVIALSPLALGGWLSAVREWRRLGIDERSSLGSLRFVFSYAKVAEEVCAGTADVGVLSASTLHDLSPSCKEGFRVLPSPRGAADPRYPTTVSTELYPEAAFAVVGPVEETLVSRLTQTLLSIESGSEVARAVAIAGFTAPLSYTPVQALMQELRLRPFEDFGQLTFAEALHQHSGKMLAALLGFLVVLTAAFVRTGRLNKRLESSEAFRKRVFEGSRLPIVVMDAETLEYIDCNPAATEIYHFASRAETLGKTPMDVSAPVQEDGSPSAENVRSYVDKALAEGSIVFEWRHQRPGGESWDAEVHLMAFRSGQRQLLQFTLQDISRRKQTEIERARLEEQLQHSQRMDSIGRLAGAIAHDFNNLLTVINGYSGLLLQDIKGPDPARREVEQIHNAGQRAAELTQQLLTFSRKQISQRIALDLNAVIRDSENMFRRLLGESIQLVTSLGAPLGLTIGDPAHAHQVLMNLVVNARDAMPAGGTVTIATANVTVGNDSVHDDVRVPAGDYIRLEVSDTGAGMDAETRRHIFEPFYSTKGTAGTGLGLSTVYGVVRQSHGWISVRSRPGHGTTFSIYLPRTERPPELPKVGDRKATPVVGLRAVLVVEDQDDVRSYARDILARAGYRVFDASTGDAALRLAKTHAEPIHLLLTDVVLQGMNGRELSERLSLVHPETKTLFTSGYADDQTARLGVLQGSLAFLPKPYSADSLLSKVTDVLDSENSS